MKPVAADRAEQGAAEDEGAIPAHGAAGEGGVARGLAVILALNPVKGPLAVIGDGRFCDQACAREAVPSTGAMTADTVRLRTWLWGGWSTESSRGVGYRSSGCAITSRLRGRSS